MKRGWSVLCVVMFSCTVIAKAMAVCTGGHLPIKEEYRRSELVGVGVVTDKKEVSTPDDPDGVAFTIYHFKFTRLLKGLAKGDVEIYSENTSSRFPMDIGTTYMVLLQAGPDGRYVDLCGNSGEIKERFRVVDDIEKMTSR